jgi:diguanylate cyclase (GGDEF)-like protein
MRDATPVLPSRAGHMTPLAERMGHLQTLRFAMAVVVLVTAVFAPEHLGESLYQAILPTLGFLAISGVAEVVRRTILKRALAVMGVALLVDGLYLGWIVLLTGGPESPFRFLLYVHLIAVTLLASYRNGLKIALWHSLLFYLGYYGRTAGILDPTGGGRLDVESGAVFDVVAFWLVAIGTAVFSAVNERELRRRKVDLEALAAMGTELEHVSTPTEVARTLLNSVCSSFSFRRGLVLGVPDEGIEVAVAEGMELPADAHGLSLDRVIREAWTGRTIRLVQKLDPKTNRTLVSSMPDARNLLVAPLSAEGNVVGVLVVEHGGRFGSRIERRVVTMVEQFAAHAALALRNASLLERIQIVAATDPLTSVANRRTFEEALEREIARSRRTGENLALVMVDIDHFKSFNDTHGHQGGDDALRRVAKALVAASREFDTVARYGGEEFAIVLPSCPREEAVEAAERLRRAVSSIEVASPVTASAGVAVFPDHGVHPDGLVREADRALYSAKMGGRNRLVIAGAGAASRSTETGRSEPISPVAILSALGSQLGVARTQADIVRVVADALWRLVGQLPRAGVVLLGGTPDEINILARRPGPLDPRVPVPLDAGRFPESFRSLLVSETPAQLKVDASVSASLLPAGQRPADETTVVPLFVRGQWWGAVIVTSDAAPPADVAQALTSISSQFSLAHECHELGEAVRASDRGSAFVEEQLRRRALLDPLTDLANRMLFMEHVTLGLRRRRSGKPLSVLVLDLDDFKSVNDSLGHVQGDQLLIDVAERVSSSLRSSDSLARIDGDEFAVLIEDDSDRDEALTVAKGLLDALAAPFSVAGRELAVRASVGIAYADTADQAAGELVRNAEVAMRLAKGSSREPWVIFEPRMHNALLERLELKVDLQNAIERDELVVHYQPIVCLEGGRLDAVEALIRWNNPQRGMLSPAHFISLAEDTGLIIPIGRWVLEEACRQAREWQTGYAGVADTKVSVNLSAKQLQDPSLPADVAHALEASGLDAHSLVLEITESVVMSDHETASHQIRKLKRLGVQIAIDDFGTGYSSLSYLRRFDLDVLKIDRYFIEGISLGSEEAALVRAIIELGKALRMEVVAEGVEVEDQLTELRALDCDLAQGYLFSRPLAPEEMEAWIVGSFLGSPEALIPASERELASRI